MQLDDDNGLTVMSRKDFTKCKILYPSCGLQRESFRTKSGKRVSEKQWAIYDCVRKVPCGKVTTYKDICTALGFGSPRSVGAAMRNNPFAPFVPCHRVIASNLSIGGFYGEWSSSKKGEGENAKCKRKLEMLAAEGVAFTKDGNLKHKEIVLWKA